MNLVDGKWQAGGIDLMEIARSFGTPAYVYDGEKILSQYRALRSAFAGIDVRIKYACKALNNPNILKLLRREGAGIDAVSLQEIDLALHSGFPPGEILYTPNCVSIEEYRAAVERGARINIDNISILDRFGHEYGAKVPVCIRVNPHIYAGGSHHLQTGHIDSKFGISIHQLRHVHRVVSSHGMNIEGLHMHTGSDILEPDVFLRGAELLYEAAEGFPDLRFLDLGSGFKVPYKEGDVTTDIARLGEAISRSFSAFCSSYGRDLELWFEPGKFLVSEAGVLLVRVNVVKQTTATLFAGVDSGQNHLIRPMFYDAYHGIVNISNPGGAPRIYSVVGYICETDTLGFDRKLSEVREGDVLAILNAGAYGYSMSNNYNARPRPVEVLVLDKQARLIRKRETFDDLLRNVVDAGL
jgi:diaminopimelate decarboxylase